jgi:hypothetical protein
LLEIPVDGSCEYCANLALEMFLVLFWNFHTIS